MASSGSESERNNNCRTCAVVSANMTSKEQELGIGELILLTLQQRRQLDSYEFSKEVDRDHQAIVGAIKSLQSVGNVSMYGKLYVSGYMQGYLPF